MTKFFTFFLLCFCFNSAIAQNAGDWVFKGEKDYVKVYYRNTSDVLELKLVTSIKSSLSGLIQLLSEVEQYPAWGYKVMEARLLRKVSDTEMYYYTRLDFPWPMSDRDIVMHSKMEQDKNGQIIAKSVAVPDYIPEVKDVIRIRKANTHWLVVPGAGGWLYTEYYIYSHPGGNIPEWLINMAIDMGPRETIKNIRKLVSAPKYQNTRLAHIRD